MSLISAGSISLDSTFKETQGIDLNRVVVPAGPPGYPTAGGNDSLESILGLLKGTQAWDNLEFFLTLIKSLYALRKFSKKKFASFPLIFALISMFEHFRDDWAYAEPNFFYMSYPKNIFVKIFTLVLLDGFLDGFWKFRLFIVKICILIWYFWVFFENYGMRMLRYTETILSHAEHTRNRFQRTLSIRGTISAHAQPAVKCEQFLHVQYMLSIRGTNFIAHWAYAEQISLHAEHTRNRFHRMLSMRGNFKSRISRPNRIWFSKISCYEPLGPYGFVFCKKSQKKISCLCTFKRL